MDNVEKVKVLQKALDDIIEICDIEAIRLTMKMDLVESIARLARGLTDDENNVYE